MHRYRHQHRSARGERRPRPSRRHQPGASIARGRSDPDRRGAARRCPGGALSGLTMQHLTIARESWPLAAIFTIARGAKTAAEVVTVTLEQDGAVGRGECVPYARYGETVEGVIAELEAARAAILG